MPGVELIIPDTVHRKFASGWAKHVPLTYLTYAACQTPVVLKVSQDKLAFNEATGLIQAVSKPLSGGGEEDLCFTEWFQAWKQLGKLIAKFLPEELCMDGTL